MKMLVFAVAIMVFTLSGRECQAQAPPCGAASFYLYGNHQNQEVLLHFIGINGNLYYGNAPEYLFNALNSPTTYYVDAIVVQINAVNGVPQDGPSTFLAPNSAEFTNVLNEALIWGAMDYWYFQEFGQSTMNADQNNFQQVYQNEWRQELGIDLAYLVDVNYVIDQIANDLATVLEDPVAADQINSLISLYPDIVTGFSALDSGNAPGILNVLQEYQVVTSQNYTSSQLVDGMANIDPSELPTFENALYAKAFPGDNLHPSAQQYLTDFFQNIGSGLGISGGVATGLGSYDIYMSYATSDLTASSATAAVTDASTFLQNGMTTLAAGAATTTIIQNYLLPQSDVLQDMVFLQNSLDQDLFPELTTVSGEMTGNNGLANLDYGPGLAADTEVISSFESIWCNLGAQEESEQIIQTQLQEYIALGPAYANRATFFYSMLTTANFLSTNLATLSATIPTPVVTGLSQSTGVLGDQITISGTGFCNAVAVYFANTPAPFVTEIPISSTQIVVGVPVGTETVDVQVVGPGGVSQINTGDKFTYGTPSPTTSAIISLSGDLTFGDVQVGTTETNGLTINNTGNGILTVNSISYPSGLTGNWSGGSIPLGGSQNVIVTFAPTSATSYSGNITVSSDASSGNNTISTSGTGINVTALTFGTPLLASVGSTFANINCWVYPGGGPGTAIYDRLGDDTEVIWNVPSGATHPIFSQVTLTGLSANTPYTFYEETGGGLISPLLSFTTLPAGGLPMIQTASYSPLTASSGQFNATISPDSQTTTAWINYIVGSSIYTSPTYSIPANDSQESIGPYTASNLPPATTIYWQVVASNLWGPAYSVMQSFQTLPLPPNIVSLTITNITSSSASISASVNPDSGDAGFSVLLTNDVTESVTNTPFIDIGSGSSPTNVAIQLTGLSPLNVYTACLVMRNSGGSNFATFQFTTLPIQYNITGSAGNGGNIYPTNVTVIAGTNLTFTAVSNINYVVNQWLLDGNLVQNGGNSYTMTNIQTNHNVEATFTYAPIYFTVSASAGNGGNVYPTNIEVAASSNVTFTANPNSGYTINQWLTNGVAVQSGGVSFTLSNVLAATTLQATFTVLPGGIISLSGNLAFGAITVGEPVQNLLEIANTGNETLTISNIIYPNAVFSGNWSGSIAPSDFQYVLVTFLPTAPGRYGGDVVVVSDAVIGTNSILISGVGLSTNPSPVLNAQMQSGSIILTWSTSAPSYALEFTTNLGQAASWSMVSNTPTVIGTQNVLTNPISGQSGFFRLQQ